MNTYIKNKIILVVEDNELNAKLFHDLLTSHGHSCTITRSFEGAYKSMRTELPDLILMDVQLPEISGLEIAKYISRTPEWSHIPIIAVTAFAMKGDEEKIRGGGCDGYIAKPISIKSFFDHIQSALEDPNKYRLINKQILAEQILANRTKTNKRLSKKGLKPQDEIDVITSLVRSTSHEIRNQLASIDLILKLLDLNNISDPNIVNSFTRSIEIVGYVNVLLDRMRNYIDPIAITRISSVDEIVSDLVETISIAIPKSTDFHIQVARGIKSKLINASAEQMVVIIRELVENAVAATSNIDQAAIGIKIYRRKNNVVFEVHDNGIGIPIDVKRQVLKGPVRKPNSSRVSVGLFYAWRLASTFDGNLSLVRNSLRECGRYPACFRLTVKILEAP